MSMARISLVIVALVFVGSCGGGSSLAWEHFDRTYLSLEPRDGFVRSDGVAIAVGGGPGVGDNVINVSVRMFYSFETGGISDDAVVESAFLRVYQEATLGSPYADLGDLVVDHVQIGADLDSGDYDGGTLASNIGTLSDDATPEWKAIDVTALVQSDVTANRMYSEFRLRFTVGTNGDASNDAVLLNDGADSSGSGNVPELVISYRAPRL